MSSMPVNSIWVFAYFAAATWDLAVLKAAVLMLIFFQFFTHDHSWALFAFMTFMSSFCIVANSEKHTFFFCRCGGAPTPEVRSPDRAARGATLSYSKSCLGMVFKPCLFGISTWTCLAMHLWAESWAPIFNIFQTCSNTCELGCPKKN